MTKKSPKAHESVLYFCYNDSIKYRGEKDLFGYVLIDKPELKIKEFDQYRSYYCGLCESLRLNHGLTGRMTLTYDMVFLDMVLSDLYDVRECHKCKRCIVHPMKKHDMKTSEVSDYCADMNVLLAYYKCLDDWNDEHKLKSWIEKTLFKRKAMKVREKYPKKAEIISKKLDMLSIFEKANNLPLDKVAHIFGEILGTIFEYKDDLFKEDLYKLGFYLGKYIYMLDAYEDISKDVESGAYNPFKEMWEKIQGNEEEIIKFDQQVYNLLLLMMGEATDAFNRLPILYNVDIIRNILYSGVWARYAASKSKLLGLDDENK